VSAGVTDMQVGGGLRGHVLATFLQHAQVALDDAKRSGRNRVVIFDPEFHDEAPRS
jgi:PleD family two-component response regulator